MPVAAEQAAVMAGPAQADSELAQRSKQLKAIGSDPAEGAQVVAANLLRQQQQHAQSAELLAAAQQQSHQIQQQQHHQHHQQQQQQSSFVADVQVSTHVHWSMRSVMQISFLIWQQLTWMVPRDGCLHLYLAAASHAASSFFTSRSALNKQAPTPVKFPMDVFVLRQSFACAEHMQSPLLILYSHHLYACAASSSRAWQCCIGGRRGPQGSSHPLGQPRSTLRHQPYFRSTDSGQPQWASASGCHCFASPGSSADCPAS